MRLILEFVVYITLADILISVAPEEIRRNGVSNSSLSNESQTKGIGVAKVLRQTNGMLVCSLNCQQGTIVYPDNTCSCLCEKNFALIREDRCDRASWSNWNAWSDCLKTEWGGLQQRQRICRTNDNEYPGACNGRGSMARTCTSVTKEFRIRMNLKDLNDEEFHDLLQAMTKFKKDKSKKGYKNIVSWHGYPFRCPWYHHLYGHDDNHCSFHHHPLFQVWHRMITVQLELGLSRHLKNKTMGIPFWDWTEEASHLPNLIKDAKVYDPVRKKFVANPFYRTFIRYHEGVKMHNQRVLFKPGLLMNRRLLKGVVRALLSHDHRKFEERLSWMPHDQIHNCFCVRDSAKKSSENCDFGLPTTSYAAWDPVFLLHHSAMDRVFVMRRMLEEQNGVADWSRSRISGQFKKTMGPRIDILGAFDWPLSPFCNTTMNPESVTRKERVWTMRNAFYNEQLFGYKYDNFNFGDNYTWNDLQGDYKSNVIDRTFWNDDHFMTKLGELTKMNSAGVAAECLKFDENENWEIDIIWK